MEQLAEALFVFMGIYLGFFLVCLGVPLLMAVYLLVKRSRETDFLLRKKIRNKIFIWLVIFVAIVVGIVWTWVSMSTPHISYI